MLLNGTNEGYFVIQDSKTLAILALLYAYDEKEVREEYLKTHPKILIAN